MATDGIPQFLSARDLAKRLGVKTETLKAWRGRSRGPQGWVHLSQTHVAYLILEVERWLEERQRNGYLPKPRGTSGGQGGGASNELARHPTGELLHNQADLRSGPR
jgi:hypothetical protein